MCQVSRTFRTLHSMQQPRIFISRLFYHWFSSISQLASRFHTLRRTSSNRLVSTKSSLALNRRCSALACHICSNSTGHSPKSSKAVRNHTTVASHTLGSDFNPGRSTYSGENSFSHAMQHHNYVSRPLHTVPHSSMMTSTSNSLRVTLDNIFSDWNRERVRNQLYSVKSALANKMMGLEKNGKVAAVLVPFCMVDGQPSVLLTLRSSSLRKHRGEVSFPGGNQDEEDPDVTYTALRETFEEIGLNPRHFDVWGTLCPSPSGKTSVVYPVLARYTQNLDLSTLQLSKEEVEEVFTCTIADLCDGGKIKPGSTQFRTKPGYTLPVYRGGPHRIWGLSAVILHQTLHLIAPGLYTFRIIHVA